MREKSIPKALHNPCFREWIFHTINYFLSVYAVEVGDILSRGVREIPRKREIALGAYLVRSNLYLRRTSTRPARNRQQEEREQTQR